MPIFSNHRPVRSLQAWGGLLQTHPCWPKRLGGTHLPLSLAGMVPPSLTNSHMACTHSPKAPEWDTPASQCLDTPVHHHPILKWLVLDQPHHPTHPWLVVTEEDQHPCKDTHRSLHPIRPCQLTEEEEPCQ